jgi:chromosome segregation ATPase
MTSTQSYKEKAAAQLEEIGQQLKQAKTKAGDLTGEASDKASEGVTALEEKFEAAKRRFEELGDASEDVWKKASAELESAWDGLKGGVKRLFG